MATCGRSGCSRAATHYLVAKVWAKGFPKTTSPLTATLGIGFCRHHAEQEATDKALLNESFWEMVDGMTRANGRTPADRASAELVVTRGDPDIALSEMRQGRVRQ